MADFTVTIDGDELAELNDIVADINRAQPTANMTAQKYVENLVLGRLGERVKEQYAAFVARKSVADLKPLLGSREDVKRG